MIELSTGFVDQVAAPPLAPVERPIDLNHLARMTLGDASLEREILQLYDRQAAMLLERMRRSTPAVAAACAHTLKGSSRGIGAWRVADESAAVELATASGTSVELTSAMDRLAAAVAEAKLAITELLRAH